MANALTTADWTKRAGQKVARTQLFIDGKFVMGIFSLSLFVKRKNRISKRPASRLPEWKRARF